jgi:hypothetical protein
VILRSSMISSLKLENAQYIENYVCTKYHVHY